MSYSPEEKEWIALEYEVNKAVERVKEARADLEDAEAWEKIVRSRAKKAYAVWQAKEKERVKNGNMG